MASDATPLVPMGDEAPQSAALQHKHWRKLPDLSSGLARAEQFLAASQFELANWLVVAFAAGIAAWFAASNIWQWVAVIAAALALALGTAAALQPEGRYPFVRRSAILAGLTVAVGCSFVWAKSELVGTEPIARPTVTWLTGRLLVREEQPAEARVRLRLAIRDPPNGPGDASPGQPRQCRRPGRACRRRGGAVAGTVGPAGTADAARRL